MNVTDLVFLVIAAVTLVGAYRVVTSEKIMHAALWLGLTFLGVAAIFLLLGAEFLAAAQVLIYVGAIMTILIFGIMLSPTQDLREGDEAQSHPSDTEKERAGWTLDKLGAVIAGGGFTLLLLILFVRTEWPLGAQHLLEETNNPYLLGKAIFGNFVVPFETASVILLVALIGAIAIAVREEKDVS